MGPLFVALVGAVSVAASQPPTPSVAVGSTEKQQKTSEDKSRTNDAKRDAPAPTFVVNVGASQSANVQTPNKGSNESDKASDERLIAWATVALAFITAALAVFTARLWFSTQKLVVGAEATAERQLRAYVGPEHWKPEHRSDGDIVVLWVQYKNFGQTPAYELTTIEQSTTLRDDTGRILKQFVTEVPPDGLQKKTLHPGQALSMRCSASVEDTERGDIYGGSKCLDIRFRFIYTDAFAKARYTNVHLVCFGNLNIQNWRYASEGNEAT